VFAYATTPEGAPSLRILKGRATMLPAQDGFGFRSQRRVPALRKEREERGTLVLLMPPRSRAWATRRSKSERPSLGRIALAYIYTFGDGGSSRDVLSRSSWRIHKILVLTTLPNRFGFFPIGWTRQRDAAVTRVWIEPKASITLSSQLIVMHDRLLLQSLYSLRQFLDLFVLGFLCWRLDGRLGAAASCQKQSTGQGDCRQEPNHGTAL
jgi:hypothetical protein